MPRLAVLCRGAFQTRFLSYCVRETKGNTNANPRRMQDLQAFEGLRQI